MSGAKRGLRLPILLFAALSLSLALGGSPAQGEDVQNATNERGFSPEKAFQIGDLDNVNLFNGNLVVTIPLGLRYPLDGGLTYGLTLAYNLASWKFTDYCPTGDFRCYNRAAVVRDDNAGLGWQLGMGELRPPFSEKNNTGGWVYVSPDGADHPFQGTLHAEDPPDGASYTRDGSYLRMKELAGGVREIEFPDGTVHKFSSTGNLLQIRTRELTATGTPRSYVNVNHVYAGSTLLRWDLSDSVGRTHTITFVNQEVDGKTVPYVSKVELSRFNTTAKSTYLLTYEGGTIRRPPQHDDPVVGSTADVVFLTRLELPDGSAYTMPVGNPVFHGQLESLTLPTLGTLKWTYRNYTFPALVPVGKPSEPDPPPDPYSHTLGVWTRTLLDENGTALGEWTYSQSLDTGTSTTTVLDPLGHEFEHRFYADPTHMLNGLPFDPNTADSLGGNRFLSTKMYSAPNGTLLRSTYVAYEWDFTSDPTDPTGQVPVTEINRRPSSERTVYHDAGDDYALSTSSSFDGLGHYRTVTTGGNFASGNVRTTTTSYNPDRGVYLHQGTGTGHTFTMLPESSPWVLGTYSEQSESEGGVTAKQQSCFDSDTGRLLRQRLLRSTVPTTTDVLQASTYDAAGNLIRRQDYGGDVQSVSTGALCALTLPGSDVYREEYTYQYGALATAAYHDGVSGNLPFKTVDRTIDFYTGLVKTSRDASKLATDYVYDLMGRLTWEKPIGTNRDGWTQYVYTPAIPDSPSHPGVSLAQVNVYRRPNGSTTAKLAESELLFDAFGRVWKERTKMPGGVWATRETLYTPQGWPSSVSEVESSSSPVRKTFYNGYDPFGRPAEIVPADGAGHKVTFWYAGPKDRTRLVKIGTSRNATTGVINETTVQTAEAYDRQGRLWKVTEDAGANNSNLVTEYSYDIGNRLSRVKQERLEGTQFRYFNYDQRGFLLSERHPEKGASGNGLVQYFDYDPRGHARRVVDGPSDLTFSFDRAERLTRIEETGSLGRVLEERTYGAFNSGSNYQLGKLLTATRHNYHERWGVDFDVAETYTYGGREGRVSQKKTVLNSGSDNYTQSFTWNELGQPASQTYPDCGHCAPGTEPTRTVSYTYTEGRLTAIPNYATSVTYHPNGLVNRITHDNDVLTTQAEDPNHLRRPASITVTKGIATLFGTGAYAYDGSGNVVRAGSDWYLYDRYGRLIEGTVLQAGGNRKQTYAYDGFSNLTSITTWEDLWPTTRTQATVPTTNRLSAASYDAAGNQLTWGGYGYTWDPFQMAKSYQGGGNDWAFVYTANGERILSYDATTGTSTFRLRDLDGKVVREFRYGIEEVVPAPDLIFADGFESGDFSCWSAVEGGPAGGGSCSPAAASLEPINSPPAGPRPLGDRGGGTNLTSPYVWTWQRDWILREGQVLASESAAEGTQFLHSDHLGTPRLITDMTGDVVAIHHYYPFGEEAASVGSTLEPLRFTGHERDPGMITGTEDDLDYMHARYFSPQLGRFLGVDPATSSRLAEPRTWNKYQYSRSNPLTFVDRDGGQEVSSTQQPIMDPMGVVQNPLGALGRLSARFLAGGTADERAQDLNKKAWQAAKFASMARSLLPSDARKALSEVESGQDRPNVRDPKGFENDGRGGTVILPTHDETGEPITYTEYTVNPREPGQKLDGKRILVGSDGKVYYTDDHMETAAEVVPDAKPIEP